DKSSGGERDSKRQSLCDFTEHAAHVVRGVDTWLVDCDIGILWNVAPPVQGHFGLRPANLTTLVHLSTSSARTFAYAAGVLATMAPPPPEQRTLFLWPAVSALRDVC